ncbi:MAG: hypothetical protein ASARMPRED_007038 [Alectoria sarmentosa]|nr:MAG: hypothetical protein ASARMPRED_007038 [Alectoria sarmentosa]
MSQFWPHTPYAEDQPLSTAILTTHVLHRGFQTGAIVGPAVGAARSAVPMLRKTYPARTSLLPILLRSSGTGAVWGVGLVAVLLPVRMWGMEDIEWKDRAWRLLENKGQVEVDSWGFVGAALGGLGVLAKRGGARGVPWRMAAGGVGVGSTAGVLGYMIWRHGIKGGKWEEAVPNIEGVTV